MPLLTDWIEKRVSYIAPLKVIPVEDEMGALAGGGLRIVNGDEEVKGYG